MILTYFFDFYFLSVMIFISQIYLIEKLTIFNIND